MFRPGQLEYHSLSASGKPGYHLQLDYRVEGTPEAPQWACFHLRFEAGATLVDEQFRMHRDVACNFLQRVRQCLRRHGVPVDADILSVCTASTTRFSRICAGSCAIGRARPSISIAFFTKAERR